MLKLVLSFIQVFCTSLNGNTFGTKYSGDLNIELVWYLNGPKQLAPWMVRYSGSNSKLKVCYSRHGLNILRWMDTNNRLLTDWFNQNNLDDTRLGYNYLLLFRFKFKPILTGIYHFKQKVQFSRALGGECA